MTRCYACQKEYDSILAQCPECLTLERDALRARVEALEATLTSMRAADARMAEFLRKMPFGEPMSSVGKVNPSEWDIPDADGDTHRNPHEKPRPSEARPKVCPTCGAVSTPPKMRECPISNSPCDCSGPCEALNTVPKRSNAP